MPMTIQQQAWRVGFVAARSALQAAQMQYTKHCLMQLIGIHGSGLLAGSPSGRRRGCCRRGRCSGPAYGWASPLTARPCTSAAGVGEDGGIGGRVKVAEHPLRCARLGGTQLGRHIRRDRSQPAELARRHVPAMVVAQPHARLWSTHGACGMQRCTALPAARELS